MSAAGFADEFLDASCVLEPISGPRLSSCSKSGREVVSVRRDVVGVMRAARVIGRVRNDIVVIDSRE